jgi:molybdopterin converting factor small subunit
MYKVELKLPSWVATSLDPKADGWLTVDKEVAPGTTVGRLLEEIAASSKDFRETVYNPAVGLVSEQINVLLNNTLLSYQEITQTKLNNGDSLLLLPVYFGG